MSERPTDSRGEVCHCDYNPSTTQVPEEDCPVHGRPYSFWVELAYASIERAQAAEAALASAKAEADRISKAADDYDQAGQHEYAGGLREAAHHVRVALSDERCHCGEPVVYGYDGDQTHHRGMCEHCDSARCDAYPGDCGRKNHDRADQIARTDERGRG